MGKFEGDKFLVQLVTKGAFVDDGGGYPPHLIETYTLRLNHVALNEWIMSECLNTRDCYEDGEVGDAQWEAHKAERAERREAWKAQVLEALEIDASTGGITIAQCISEVFTVVHIREMTEGSAS